MRRNEILQEENNLNKSFQEIFENIKNDVTKTQLEIMINANVNLVNLYYRIGKKFVKIRVGKINLLIIYL